jgi:hypothetical protein
MCLKIFSLGIKNRGKDSIVQYGKKKKREGAGGEEGGSSTKRFWV